MPFATPISVLAKWPGGTATDMAGLPTGTETCLGDRVECLVPNKLVGTEPERVALYSLVRALHLF